MIRRLALAFLVSIGAACVPESRGAAPPVERVISLVPSVTDLIVAMGHRDRLVGRSMYDRDPLLAHLPSVGDVLNPSTESLAALQPDLVIVSVDHTPAAIIVVERTGARTMRLKTGSIIDLRDTLDSLGRILNAERSADSIWSALEDTLDAVRGSRSAGRDSPVVFWALSPGPVYTTGGDTFLNDITEVAGARNLFEDLSGWPVVSLEEAVDRQPDLIIVSAPGSREEVMRRYAGNPAWGHLQAFREGRVMVADGEVFHRPGPRLGEAARLLSDSLARYVRRRGVDEDSQ